MKKIILLATALVLSLSSYAEFEVDGIYYYINDSGGATVSGSEQIENVVIPPTVSYNGKDYSVNAIGTSAFSIRRNRLHPNTILVSITIPESVKTIDTYAFDGDTTLTSVHFSKNAEMERIGPETFRDCKNLAEIVMPKSVDVIEKNVFYNCLSLPVIDNVRYADTYAIEPVDRTQEYYNIKRGTTYISSYAFQNCSLKYITLPESITTIGDYAFFNCPNLSSIFIPESVTAIGTYAFRNCSSLKSFHIPKSVTKIGSGAFYGCNSLPVIGGVRYADTYAVFIVRTEDKVCVVREGTKWIGDSFYDAYLTPETNVIVLPESVTNIGPYAFYNNKTLTSINIPKSVTTIGEYAFCNCVKLSSPLTIEASEIGAYAFQKCENLKVVNIGGNIKRINPYTFDGCTGLEELTLSPSIETIEENAFSGCKSLSKVEFPTSVKAIGSNAFSSCGLTSINIPGSVTTIGEFAFQYCSSLKNITLSREIVPGGICYGCTSLEKVVFSDKVKEIQIATVKRNSGTYTCMPFENCPQIKEVESHAVRPPACDGKIFDDEVYRTAELRVYTGSCEYYYSALGWNHFYTIYDDDFKYIQTDEGLKIIPQTPSYDLNGRIIPNNIEKKGIYISNGKKYLQM